jgi:hypothetical protein
MNVKLQYELDFMAGIYYEGTLQLNHYSVSLQLLTQTADPLRTNIAMERLKAFVYAELCDAVFVGPEDQDKVEMLSVMGINVATLPDQPVDQIIGVMLYCKLNAVMEEQMLVTKLDIQSYLGDSVWYQHDEDDAIGPFSKEGWWHEPSCKHNDIDLDPVSDKVVKVASTGWSEYRLDWPEAVPENAGNTVVFANFQKNENQPTQ